MMRIFKAFLALCLFFSASAFADTIEADTTKNDATETTPIENVTIFGKQFPTELLATEDSPHLYLQGGAVRKVYNIVNTYVGLLYIGDKTVSPELIASTDMPRRMEFHLLSNRVTSKRFVKVIEEGLALNTTPEEMAAIESRVHELFKLFDYKWTKGTLGWIEWVPSEQVSRIVINGDVRGTVAGKDLSDALLRIWVGEKPVSERFKRQVLGLDGLEVEGADS